MIPEEPPLRGVVLLPKPIDNTRVVREVDPRSHRDLFLILALVLALVGACVLYAWPHLQLRQTTQATQQLLLERQKLIEENRKLHLEKATLEDLARVETIARRDLGLVTPPPARVVIVEEVPPPPSGTHVASVPAPGAGRN